MTKTCRRCGVSFEGHFNARFCGDECRLWARRDYMRTYIGERNARTRSPKEPERFDPFPESIDRESFGHWLAGFADGEATFVLRTQRDSHRGRTNHGALFRITVRDDDSEALGLIRSYWRCGTIHHNDNARSKIRNAKPIVAFGVQKISDLADVVIPHFERYPLRAKKRNDFGVWRLGVELLAKIQSRPMLPNYGAGGNLPRWTEAERELFRSLSEQLKDSRAYPEPFALRGD
jgi:hypothetical protein